MPQRALRGGSYVQNGNGRRARLPLLKTKLTIDSYFFATAFKRMLKRDL